MNLIKSRERLYRVLWSLADRRGVIQRSQGEIASLMDMSYQQLSIIFREFVGMGMLHKDRHEFTVLHHPNKIPWDEGYRELREKYIEQIGPINATKANRTG